MKTKLRHISNRALAVLLGMLMIVSSLVVGSVFTADAADTLSGGRVYVDLQGNWSDSKYVYLAVWYSDGGSNSWRYLRKLSNITGTTVWTNTLANNGKNVTGVRILCNKSSDWTYNCSDNGWTKWSNDSGYGADYYSANFQYGFNNGTSYYFKVDSNGNVTTAYDSNTINNYTSYRAAQSIQVQYLANGAWTNNTSSSKAGNVQLSGRYYSDDTNTTTYNQTGYSTAAYNNTALHSTVTASVTSTVSGYTFAGWYDGNTFITDDEEYSYFVTGVKTINARFFKADEAYTTEIPASEAKVLAGTLVLKKNSRTPGYASIYNVNQDPNTPDDKWLDYGKKSLTRYNSTDYYLYNDSNFDGTHGTGYDYPKAWISQTQNWDNDNICAGNISPPKVNDVEQVPSSRVWYYECTDNTNNGTWTLFEHLEITLNNVKLGDTIVTDSSTNGQIDNPGQTLTINATLGGTLKSGSTVKFYYTNDGGTTHYLIGTNSNVTTATTSINFIPPTTGKYTFYATVSDAGGLEVDVPAGEQFDLTVGTEGYYVSGNTEFVGSWDVANSKGKMTETATSGVWKKVFKSVPAGTHQFRITDLGNYLAGTSGTNATKTYALTGDGVELSTSGDNIQFTLDGKSKVTVTVNSTKDGNGKYPVTVKVEEVAPKTVTVYANTGGTVAVTYNGATFDVAEGKSTKVKVGEGDTINLVATPGEGYDFDHWEKNLEASYSPSATLNDETIDDTTVYVADFGASGGSGDWTGTHGGTSCPDSPTIGASTSKYFVYAGNDDGPGKAGTQLSAYNSGNYYFADLTSVTSSGGNFFFALSGNTNNGGIHGNKSEMINGQTVPSGNSIEIKDTSGNKLFIAEMKFRDTVTNNANFILIRDFQSSRYSAIGVQAFYSGSGSVNYQFFYKAAGGGGATEGTEFSAAVSYYAKDSNFHSQSTAKNKYITTDTTVEGVEDLVTVEDDSANNLVKGKAVKGCNITVSTEISGTCKNGTGADVYAADKYYVVGYSFNGITPELLSPIAKDASNKATYTCTYTIPVDMTESYLEITPIYFLKDAYDDNTAMFYINGFDDQVKDAGWGNTLFVYPFYRRYENDNNDKSGGDTTFSGQAQNFAGYPGQPVVNYGGQLYTQIPLTNDGSANGTDSIKNPIKGVTINNGYFDNCHKAYCNFVTNHHQTYDYDDFQKIYREKQKDSNGDKYLHSIFFSFKYYPQDTTNQHRLYSKTNSASKGSRYNDTIESDTRLSTEGTVSNATMTSYPATTAESKNKWEDLTDALGNKVDLFGNTVTKTTDYPIKVVSMGYEYNNSGEYATEWAVYYWDGSNYTLAYDSTSTALGNGKALNSSIVPSALVMNKADNFSNYTAMDGDVSIASYSDLYTELKKYAGYPVEICYEYDAPIHYNDPPAYRCDGRWTYTTVNDFVKSNIKIEYKAKNASDYVEDTFTNVNEGTNSKCKAYFTNSEYYGAIKSDSELIDATDHYTFKAEEGGSYEFAGWYAKDSAGKYQKIENVSETLEAESAKTANITFVARFDYVATGNLTISNTVASSQTGMATTYLGVTVINGTSETVIANVASNTAAVKLDKAYIASNSNYDIRIDIRTVPTGENTFASYTCNTTNGSDVKATASDTDIYDSSNASNSTDTYTVNVKSDIFNSGDTQVVKAIEYVSTLKPVTYNYTIKYNYTSRSYGDQAYTKTGTLTSGQINDATLVTGTVGSKSFTSKLLQKLAPHESNFNTSITWNYSDATGLTGSYNSGSNTYTFNIAVPKAEAAASTARKAYFTVPYVLSSAEGANGLAAISTYGEEPNQIEYGVWAAESQTFVVSGTYEQIPKGSDSNNITAPVKVLVSGTPGTNAQFKFFKYWKFSTTKGKEVGRCYYPEFNYVLYENYNVEAVYSNAPGNYDTNATFGTDYAADTSTSISYIGNSRNQWNSGDKGTVNATALPDAGDMIYNDFIISYKPGGNTLIKDIEGAETGIIIQRLDTVTPNSSGKNSITLDDYATKFSADELSTNLTKIISYASSDRTTAARVNGHMAIKQTIDSSSINNKNRIHYAYKMYNTYDGTEQNTKQYFYRVYSYMKVNGTTTVSSTPTYFCMYDIATE